MLTGGNNAHDTIVCDVGAYLYRGGFAGDATPVSFPTSLGYVLEEPNSNGSRGTVSKSTTRSTRTSNASSMDVSMGNGRKKRAIVGSGSLNIPIDGMSVRSIYSSGGLVDDWSGYEQLWVHFFGLDGDGLIGAKSEDKNIILTEQPFTPPRDREKICELLFEKFLVPSVSFIKTSALGAFATGRTSALTVDVGHSVVTSCAVQDGFFLRNTIAKSDFAGNDLSQALLDILNKKRENLNLYPECLMNKNNIVNESSFHQTYKSYHVLETTRRIKEALCYVSNVSPFDKPIVSSNIDNDIAENKNAKSYKLPDGTTIVLSGTELSSVPEMLFTTPTFGSLYSRVEPLSKLIYKSVQYCKNLDFGRSLWSNVVLIGGSSVYDGMTERLANELAPLTAQSLPVKVIPAGKPSHRKNAAWLGGSILGSLPENDLKMSKEEFLEHGAKYINECCP